MVVTASKLRENIYRILDEVLETGTPVEIERRGKRLRIVAAEPANKLDRIIPDPSYLIGDYEDIVHMDWSEYWDPGPELERMK